MKIRNVAVIAHVDHGKTTLVDAILHQSGTFAAHQEVIERVMDHNDLERERGITILAKCTSITFQSIRINLVDTPGHADFGGEVERILGMVDGALLLVDAAEGVMPQTKFVLGKTLELGLCPIVVINKLDRNTVRTDKILADVFDLFANLGASEEQLDFPILYASGKEGWAVPDLSKPSNSVFPLLEVIVRHIPAPVTDAEKPFSMLASILEYDPYLGRVITGRIHSGQLRPNMNAQVLSRDGKLLEQTRLTKVLAYRGLKRIPLEEASAGDIVAIAGLQHATVSDTICDLLIDIPITAPSIDPPTLSVIISVNDSPLAGREGNKVTSRMLRERLFREADGNVAIRVSQTDNNDSFEIAGRGELQIGILVETMRREGYELAISRPQVLYKIDKASGKTLEPIEEVIVDVDEDFAGIVVEKMGVRLGELQDMRFIDGGKRRLTFLAPSRGLIGYHGELLTDTSGTGFMSRIFHSYGSYKGQVTVQRNGVMVSNKTGRAVPYALWNLEERGKMFIKPGAEVYNGMIIGEHTRSNDLDVNPLKTKQLTNIRAAGKDNAVRLSPPQDMSLESAIAYIADDELVEVTPHVVRLRKKLRQQHERKKATRKTKS